MNQAFENLFDLSHDIAVVIGATGFLGGAIAEGLAGAGARVAIVGRNGERGTHRANLIRDKGGRADFFEADALDAEAIKRLHQLVLKKFGPPTILVNAAGANDPRVSVTPDRPFGAVATDDWRIHFDLNLVGGVLLPCQEFGPAMAAHGRGSIINIAGVSGHTPLSSAVAESAAKASVINVTRFLAREWGRHGVRVNSITPGFFPGDQNRRLIFNEDGSTTARGEAILEHTPTGRFGEKDELAGAAIFLASNKASSFVTGIDLRVDGGFLSQTI